jgi:hypothetical protein
MNRSTILLALCSAAALLVACPAPEEPPVEPPFLGADPSVPAAPGEARAGVIREGAAGEAALFGGVNSEGRAGDVKIYDDRVQFVIGAPRRSHGFVDVGGSIIDVDLVRDDGTLGQDTVEDVFLSFALGRLFEADELVIVSDGTEGGAAHVRATGKDVPWELMQGLFELDEPTVPDLHLAIVTDYVLQPDSFSLELTTTLTNTADVPVSILPRDGIMASGEDLLPWADGRGMEGPEGNELQAVGVVGRQGEPAVILWPDSGSLTSGGVMQLAAELGIVALGHGERELGPGESLALVRSWSVAPDPLTVEGERWTHQGVELGAVVGRVTDSEGGVAGVRIHFVRADEEPASVAGHVLTAADGAFRAELPPGEWTAWAVAHSMDEHVQLPVGSGRYGAFAASTVNAQQLAALDGSAPAPPVPFAQGRTSPAPVGFSLASGDEVPLDFELEAASGLSIALLDADGAPLPGVVDVRWSGAPAESPVPPELRKALEVPDGSRAAWGWTSTGQLDLPALPGTYTIHAGHSWRHDRATATEVIVAAGERPSVELVLAEIVQRDGWLSMDSHLHGAPSFDGALAMEHRLVACAATGVEIPVLTDHDRNVDYAPLAAALGLDPRMHVVPGYEVTTIARGHFNLFPTDPDPLGSINGGVVSWWDIPRDTEELFEWMREAVDADTLLQVNHPRTPGMNALAGYDPEVGEPDRPRFWSWDFELVEILNGGVDDLDLVREDWFSFLNTGRKVVPVGVSDSHYTFIPCGHGRTDVFLDTTDVAEVTTEQVRQAVLDGHVVVGGGTTLRATLDAGDGPALPGDTVVGGEATLAAQVRTPGWFAPGTLRVYRNGAVIAEEELDEAPLDGLWFDGSWTVESDADAWFAVEVQGTEPMGDAWRNNTPYALTNAFFLDVDGDGWSAPGLAGD